jgi:zinc protease
MLKNTIILMLFCCISVALQSQVKIDYTEYDLENGLHVILHKDNTTPITAVSVMYHTGSKNEDPSRTGFAHFFEHLMFEGSENIPRGQYFRIVQNAGGELNASTDFDRTYYYQVLPSNQLELGLWLESERMLHLKIDSLGVETQRNVVKEERKERLDNQPYGKIWEETFSRAYTQHPYKWMPIGSAQYIDEATLDEFYNFYKTYYVPQNAVLSIAGDIDIDNTKKLVQQYFGNIPAGKNEIKRPEIKEPPQVSEVRDTVYDKIQLPAVLYAYHIPPIGTRDYYVLQMLNMLLSQGQSSRLYKALVDNQQKAAYVGSFPAGLEDPGLLIMLGIANMGVTADEFEKALNEEIEKLKIDLIPEEEFQKLRNQIENSFVNRNSTVAGIAENLAYYYTFFRNTNLINTESEKYSNFTREDLKAAAEQYLRKENRVVLYYLPVSQKKAGAK